MIPFQFYHPHQPLASPLCRSDTTYHAPTQSQSRESFQSIAQNQVVFMFLLSLGMQKSQAGRVGPRRSGPGLRCLRRGPHKEGSRTD